MKTKGIESLPGYGKYWTYHVNVVPKAARQRLYEACKHLVDKEKKDTKVFGKPGKEQRYTGFYRKEKGEFTYSGVKQVASGDYPAELLELEGYACKELPQLLREGAPNASLINYYPDGAHMVGEHSDKDGREDPILSFSLGAERDFLYREQDKKAKHSRIILEDGSMLVMWPGFQERFWHQVPRQMKVKRGRINVTQRHHRATTRNTKAL